jgi:hypothetical protein
VRADASIRPSICQFKLSSDANPKWHHANPTLQLASIVGWTHFVRCHVLNHTVSAITIFHLPGVFFHSFVITNQRRTLKLNRMSHSLI